MLDEPVFYPLSTRHLDFRRLDSSRPSENGHTPVEDFQRLARALAASSAWQEMVRAVFVIRRGQSSTLALLGYFTAAQQDHRSRVSAGNWKIFFPAFCM
jgi:hypothetical protein